MKNGYNTSRNLQRRKREKKKEQNEKATKIIIEVR